jgi:4-azaleucine resistance transporter AzlC
MLHVQGIFKQAVLRSLPVMMGYVFLGTAFGLLLQRAGYHWLWALGISVFVYAGSLQFVLVGLLTQGASLLTVGITTLVVNSRHIFYGLSFIESFKKMGKWGTYMIFSLTDETYALLCGTPFTGSSQENKRLKLYISALDQSYWVFGSLMGALVGDLITFDITGIDFAMTALFTVIVVEQWLSTKNHIPALVGFICAVIALLIFGPDQFLLPALITCVTLLMVFKQPLQAFGRKKQASENTEEPV